MKKNLLVLFIFLPAAVFSQYELYNKGGDIYTQKGALIHVQGSFTNDNTGGTAQFNNDGILELKGDLDNQSGATFTTNGNPASRDRAVKFVGSGTQVIKGQMSGTSSFFNLVIDKTVSSGVVEMQTNAAVKGSLVFGNNNTTTSYQPSVTGTNNLLKGLLKTYDNSSEYLLDMQDGNQDCISGYPLLNINGAPATGYILTKGNRASAAGGVQRAITGTGTYVFPFGTTTNGFNGVQINFATVPGSGSVKGKFCDGTSNPSGYVGSIPQICAQCPPSGLYAHPDNAGYNRVFGANACNGNTAQWVVLEESILNHGYWSFESSNSGYTYSIEAFANSFTDLGTNNDTWRLLKYAAAYGVDPTTFNWGAQIESSVSSLDDLLTYTRNTGCYTGNGVPGGLYTNFSHFMMAKSKSANTLPVELIYLRAEGIDNSYIKLNWATSLEINNAGFEVLRSIDGVNYSNIGWVDGHNNSTVQQNYAFNDHTVVPNLTYYYKLNQKDFDGQHEETYVVSASLTGEAQLVLSGFIPNPANDKTKLVITTSAAQQISAKLFNSIGEIVFDAIHNLNAGENNLYFETHNLSAGTYMAVVQTAEKYFSKKLVVNK